MNSKSSKFSPEVRKRTVQMVLDHRGEYPSLWAAIHSIAGKTGCTDQTLRNWVRKHEVDTGVRDGVTSDEQVRVKALELEIKENWLRSFEQLPSIYKWILCCG